MYKKFKTYIIAEAGVNHNGKLNLAYKLVDSAKNAGADCVKFQLFNHQELTTINNLQANYQIKNTKKKQTQFELLKKLEMNFTSLKKIKNFCKKKKIDFLLSVFGTEELKIIKKLNLKTIKIPSGEINNFPLLKKISKLNKNLIISTGMADFNEIKYAIKILKKNNADLNKISILQCTTDYPTRLKDVNLNVIKTLKNYFKLNVGLSDHTIGNEAAIAAVAIGAKIIEKHITLNNSMLGPDHKASLNPKKFKDFVKSIRNTESLLGSYLKKPCQSEIVNKEKVRKSIVAKKNINKGENFNINNITCKRPEGGISPIYWEKVIGKKSKYSFQKDDFIVL